MPGNGVKRLGYLNSTIMKVEDIERIFKETVSRPETLFICRLKNMQG